MCVYVCVCVCVWYILESPCRPVQTSWAEYTDCNSDLQYLGTRVEWEEGGGRRGGRYFAVQDDKPCLIICIRVCIVSG